MRRLLDWRMAVPILVSVAVAGMMVAVMVASQARYRDSMAAAFQNEHFTRVQALSGVMEMLLQDTGKDLSCVGEALSDASDTSAVADVCLSYQRQHSAEVAEIAILGPRGELLYATSPCDANVLSRCPEFGIAGKTGRLQVSAPLWSVDDPTHKVVVFFVPVAGANPRIIAAVARLEQLCEDVFSRHRVGMAGTAMVLDEAGEVVYHSVPRLMHTSVSDQTFSWCSGRRDCDRGDSCTLRLWQRMRSAGAGLAATDDECSSGRDLLAYSSMRLANQRYWMVLAVPESELATPIDASANRLYMLAAGLVALLACGIYALTRGSRARMALRQELELKEQRQQAAQRIEHLNVVLRAIRSINQLITQEKDRATLLVRACQIMVESRGYYRAWIALLDGNGQVASAHGTGEGEDFTRMFESIQNGQLPRCLQLPLDSGEPLTFHARHSDCGRCPILQRQAHSTMASARLEYERKLLGVLVVSAAPGIETDQEERGLLLELVGDIAFALGNMELEQRRKLAEEQALRENAKLASMISGMDEGVVFADADNVIVEVNDYFCRVVGRRREEILGKRIEDFHSPQLAGRLGAAITSFRQNPQSKAEVVHKRIADMDVILRMQPICSQGRYDGVLLNVVNVTELVAARRAAEDASQAKSAFLANMSHEIRTPLTAILGFADMLCESSQTASDRLNCVSALRRNGEHLLSLISDILDVSKIEAGKFTCESAPCRLHNLIADVVSMMRLRADNQGMTLAAEYLTPLPETILTDEPRLRQALVNLVGNAIKFTERGGVRIQLSLLPLWRATPAIQISVIDTGIGIDSATLAGLFRPFVQGDASTNRKYGGTGLGLAITRHIAGMLGGELTARSEVGRGSTFTLILPTGPLDGIKMLQRPSEAVLDRAHPTASVAPDALRGRRILLAEDGADNVRIIGTILRVAGAEVAVAENGRLAVERATAERFDLILMDMQMPEMDGYQAARQLRAQGLTTPILALTAHALSSDRQRCLQAGCDEYLTKPVDRAKLIATVARFTAVPAAALPAPSVEPLPPIVSLYADDRDLTEVIAEFVAGLPGQIDAIRHARNHGDWPLARRLAHQLKGAGGSYGYPAVTDAALRLEQAAAAADTEGAALAWDELNRIGRAIALAAPARAGETKP